MGKSVKQMIDTLGYNRPLVRKQCKALATKLCCTITTYHRGSGGTYYRVAGSSSIYWTEGNLRAEPERAGWRCYDWREVMQCLRAFQADLLLLAYGLDSGHSRELLQVAANHDLPRELLAAWVGGMDDLNRLVLADWLEDRYNEHGDQADLQLARVLREAGVPPHMQPAQETPEQVAARTAPPAPAKPARKPRKGKAGPGA
jgi:hypothetical protein